MRHQYLSKFLYLIKGKYKELLFMVLLFVFISCLEVIGTGLIGPFISLATNPNLIAENNFLNSTYRWLNLESQSQFLVVIGCFIIAIFFFKAFLSFNSQKLIFEFGFRQQGELSAKLMNRYLGAPYTFHLGRNSASLIQNITIETKDFSNSVMMPLLTSISNIMVILALVGLLVKTSAMAMIIVCGILIISYGLLESLKHKIARWGKSCSDSITEMIRSVNHGMGSFKETKIIGCESYFEDELASQIQRYSVNASLATSFGNLPRYAIEAFLITFLIIFTFFYIFTNQGDSRSLSSVLGIFALASIRLLPAISNLLTAINTIRFHAVSTDKIYLDLKELESVDTNNDSKSFKNIISSENHTKPISSFRDRIILDNVSYSIPSILTDHHLTRISLVIQKGESIGLIGRSGAGKTTLVDTILGLLAPQEGRHNYRWHFNLFIICELGKTRSVMCRNQSF